MVAAKTLTIVRIERSGGTQSRAGLNEEVVEEYAALYRAGVKLAPVVVFYDGDRYWLGDGFHRVEAHVRAGKDMLAAEIRQGTREDAIWFACGANKAHGLRRTNADKRIAAERALRLKPELSDRALAEHVGVSHEFVRRTRAQVATVDTCAPNPPKSQGPDQRRTGADGRQYPASPSRSPAARVDTSTSQDAPDEETYTYASDGTDDGLPDFEAPSTPAQTMTSPPAPGPTPPEAQGAGGDASPPSPAPAPAPPVPPGPAEDRDGRPIPPELRPAWRPLWVAAQSIETHLRNAQRDLDSLTELVDYLLEQQVPGRAIGRVASEATALRASADELIYRVSQLAPHTVCGACVGAGCEACSLTGWRPSRAPTATTAASTSEAS